jgi:hypothetical protein
LPQLGHGAYCCAPGGGGICIGGPPGVGEEA